MQLSVNWLRELVNFTGSVSDLEDLLTRVGCKVESIEPRGIAIGNVVVAEILESERHPNADRLSVCRVADGTAQPRQIVCGAKNYRVGDKVPLALPGAVLVGNLKIQISKLRGVESQGMLCNAKELGWADDAKGLLILPKDAVIGVPISTLFPPDSILDLEITPNRGDWLSHLGIAREVVTFTGASLNWKPPRMSAMITDLSLARTEDVMGCPGYSLRRIRDVQISQSPAWLRSKLEAVGLQSVNNIVDVTNYVMILLGQPLHAFDTARVQGGIVVRAARGGEQFQALDGRNYVLVPGDLVITDTKGVVALAGVMGGAHSGITAATTDVLLESAVFDPVRIRRTSRRMQLFSESSNRFEKGVDESAFLVASELATKLICEVAGGMADTTVIVARGAQPRPVQITLRHNQVNRLLGLNLDGATIRNSLDRLGLKSMDCSEKSSIWEIPGFRKDLTREVDLVEEVARVIGIEAIPERISAEPSPGTQADATVDFYAILHQRLTALGFFEARTSVLVAANSYRDFIVETKTIRLKNPLGVDQTLLRPSLIPGLLSVLQKNWNHGQRTVRLYEIGKVFRCAREEEIFSLGIVMTGASASLSWRGQEVRPLDLYDLKGAIQTVAAQPLRFMEPSNSQYVTPLFFPEGSLCLHILTESGRFLGLAGQLAPARSRDLGVPEHLLVAELCLQGLQEFSSGDKRFLEIPRYPSVRRDIAVVVPKALSYEKIREILLAAGEPLLSTVIPFDVYLDPTGEKLPVDRKSIAVSLMFRSSERTLTNEEVTAAEERLKQQLVTKLSAEFRE